MKLSVLALALSAGAASAQPVTPSTPSPRDQDTPIACHLPDQYIPRSTWSAWLWAYGIVYYAIDDTVSQTNRDRLQAAMDELESIANIHFVPRTDQWSYVYIQNGAGNSSYVGQVGGPQGLTLANWNYKYIICHELMHALGLWHEQQRPDRDSFVSIVAANIQPGYEPNFAVVQGAATFGAFDFESVMLYDDCSFSTCCPTGTACDCPSGCASILALPAYAQFQSTMGNRSYLSAGDKAGLISRYGASTTGGCYANCDASTAPPALNANDFQCFLNKYAAGDPAANCDGSTAFPILNANDFQCFLNQFASGCP